MRRADGPREDRRAATPTTRFLGPLLIFAGTLAYLGVLRGYGFQVEDEGLLLFQFDRVFRGQVPYLDFHTGYTPGLYYGAVAIYDGLGRSALAIRAVLAVLNATSAALLYVAGRRLVGAWMALVPPLLWIVFVPLYPGEFAAFNVPYPTWPATVTWLVLALALLRWVRVDGAGALVVAGAAAAATLAFRPNSGAFAIAAATWIVVAFARRTTALDRVVAVVASAFMALGVWIVFDRRVVGTDAAVHVLPLLVVAVGCVGPFARTGPGGRPRQRTAGALAILGTVFLIPTAWWMGHFLALLGREVFAREVLLLGSDYATLYYRPHPAPELYALAVVGGALLLSGVGWMVRRNTQRNGALRLAPAPVILAALAVVGVTAVGLGRFAVMPEGWRDSVLLQAENALFWLTPLANYGGIVALGRAAWSGRDDARTRALTVLTVLAIAMYWQMYPRSDVMHQITAAPLALLIGVALLNRVLGWWEAGQWTTALAGRRVVRGGCAVVVVALLATKLSLTLPGAFAVLAGETRGTGSAGLSVGLEPGADDDLSALYRAAAYVADHTGADEPVFAFPAAIGILFAADRPSPVPQDYWFPGRPDHLAETAVLERFRATPPRYIVTVNTGWTFFAGAPGYFLATRQFVTGNYRLAARFGRFDVLAHRSVAATASPVVVQTSGPMADAIEPQLARRRQAARRWMVGLTPEAAAVAELPHDPHDAILLLRALRDGGDMRAAGWILAGYRSADPRIRREALKAMPYLVEELAARRLRWANDEDPPDAVPFVRPYTTAARALLADAEAAPFAQALLAITDGSAPRSP